MCCAGSRLSGGVDYETVIAKLKRRMATLRSAIRSTRTPASAPSTPSSSSTRSRPRAVGSMKAQRSTSRPASCRARILVRTTVLRTSRSRTGSRRRRSSDGPFGADFRTPTRRSKRPTTRPMGSRWCVDREGLADLAMAAAKCGSFGPTLNRFDPASPFGGYKESASVARADARARAVRVWTSMTKRLRSRRPTSSTSAERSRVRVRAHIPGEGANVARDRGRTARCRRIARQAGGGGPA